MNYKLEVAREDGRIIVEGKTKAIMRLDDTDDFVWILSKDDITAGDGAKHDLIPGKAKFSTQTTCNVFRFLQLYRVPVAFVSQVDDTTFQAPFCHMLPYEVVVRREAHGSYLKRKPDVSKGYRFGELLVEFFLKTNRRKWKNHELLCDDPLMKYEPESGAISLYEPSKPIKGQVPFLVLSHEEVFSVANEDWKFPVMTIIAKRVFRLLESAWLTEGGRNLVDFKVEFGVTRRGELLLADVIDNDSWRVLEDGRYIDKQSYRDGGDLSEVAAHYQQVAEITGNFTSADIPL